MRTNKTLRIASVLLIAVLMTTCIIGGTFAKYTATTGAVSDTATVAKWDVKYNGGTLNDTVTFDLFNTIKDTNGTAETDVVTDKIAPGTQGSFAFTIANASEVNADYTIAFTATNNGVPIEFSLTGTDGWTTDISTLGSNGDLDNVIDGVAGTDLDETTAETEDDVASVKVTVYWRWAYEVMAGDPATPDVRDEADTLLGTTPVDVVVSAEITVVQVD